MGGVGVGPPELSRIQPVEPLLSRVAEACGRLFDAESAAFRLRDGEDLQVCGTWGTAKDLMPSPALKVGESLTGIVAATGEPLIADDPANDPRLIPLHRERYRQAGIRAFLGVPGQGRRAGCRRADDPDQAGRRLLAGRCRDRQGLCRAGGHRAREQPALRGDAKLVAGALSDEGSARPVAEDGGDRPARGRRRARFTTLLTSSSSEPSLPSRGGVGDRVDGLEMVDKAAERAAGLPAAPRFRPQAVLKPGPDLNARGRRPGADAPPPDREHMDLSARPGAISSRSWPTPYQIEHVG